MHEQHALIVQTVERWVNAFVVDLDLCPFAGREMDRNRVRFALTEVTSERELLEELQIELERLSGDVSIETTILIHPNVLQKFDDYNQFLNAADGLLVDLDLEGVYQIASFHPQYRFAGTDVSDAENYTNRSPYPMLHLLREASVSRAIAGHVDIEKVPQKNIELMKNMGGDQLDSILKSCYTDNSK